MKKESYVDEQNADINMGMIQNGMEELKVCSIIPVSFLSLI